MPLIPVENVGAGGLITDFKPYQLQPNQWSGAMNVEFTDGSITKIDGYKEVMATCPIEPWHLGTYQEHDSDGKQERDGFYWLAFGIEEIYVYGKGEWKNVTRGYDPDDPSSIQKYNTLEGSDWKVAQSGAILLATNGVDTPQYWELDEENKVSVDNPFIDLPNWLTNNTPEETDLNCQTLSGFKNHIIATAITRKQDNSVLEEEQNRMVKWSTPHGHYAVPSSWDVLNPDLDAGEYELLDTRGPIVDTLAMGEVFMVYKTDSVVMMNYVGTPWIFSFKTLDPDTGILAKGAVTEFPGGHFFVSHADCHVNNGQTISPILTGKVRDQMFNDMNGVWYNRIFCVTQPHYNEVWACYPTSESDYCNKAMVWNYKDNTFSFRELPDVTDIKPGVAVILTDEQKDQGSNVTWENSDETWILPRPDPYAPPGHGTGTIEFPWGAWTTEPWGAMSYRNVVSHLVFASPERIKLYRERAGQMNDDEPMRAYVERTGIDFGDPSSVKHLRAVWPKVDTSGTEPIDVYTGYQMSTDTAVTWDGPFKFYPETQSKVSTRTTGKFIAIRFETKEDAHWTISGLELEFQPSGRRGSRNYA